MNKNKLTNILKNLERQEILPDPCLNISKVVEYGYFAKEVLPLSKERAVELFEENLAIYLLYPDNTEVMVTDVSEFDTHTGYFGIDKIDWLHYSIGLTPIDNIIGERIKTSRGSFSITQFTVNEMEKLGYSIHHSTNDGKYSIMSNGEQAFAVENFLKTAELSVEQNHNMIDGIINNEAKTSILSELSSQKVVKHKVKSKIKTEMERWNGTRERWNNYFYTLF